MSAERLREAARVLRERAEAVDRAPWRVQYIDPKVVAASRDEWFVMGCFDGDRRNPTGPFAVCEWEPSAAYIATMHPGVGLALADWLENVTACCDECMSDPTAQTTEQFHALRLADLILGDAP